MVTKHNLELSWSLVPKPERRNIIRGVKTRAPKYYQRGKNQSSKKLLIALLSPFYKATKSPIGVYYNNLNGVEHLHVKSLKL